VAEAAVACWAAIQAEKSKASSMLEIPEALFNAIPDISVDYAVMEKSTEVAVVPGNFGWSDIGSWNAIQNLIEPDENNNRSFGSAIFVNSQNTFIQSENRMVAAVGLDNIMIIDTVDALLVANPECSQEVKKVVNALKKTGHDTFRLHKTVHRPWGSYTVLEEGPGFKMKRIEVKPGGRLSLQSHQHRSEHWIVVKGEALVINGESERIIKQNESTFIPAKHKHRLENRTQNDLKIIEIQCGDYLGEDDIVRFDDVYGRVGKT
jgi:mannose-1-phosphate guanylyltransferase